MASSLPEGSYALDQIQDYVHRHRSEAQRKHGLTAGALMTVAALQGKVSSKNESPEGTRGQGTIAMLEFFQRIYDLCANQAVAPTEMALIWAGSQKDQKPRDTILLLAVSNLGPRPFLSVNLYIRGFDPSGIDPSRVPGHPRFLVLMASATNSSCLINARVHGRQSLILAMASL